MKRVLTGAGALLLLATAACGGTSSGTTSTSYKGNTIKLGAVFSLTGLGGVYGPQSKNAALLAQDDINAKGGVNGATIQLTVVDDGSDKTQAAQQTQTLIQEDGVIALLGPTLSNSAVAAHPVADSLKTPMMGTSNTGLNIVGTCPYPCDYIFRDSLGEQDAIPANIKTYADA
ncbi:MAG TPA: ABC transporter substrate-binding protein, partial [Candidatus Dormibacteraeota bacterium]|nr:ABC transporter substrate-binding protein [Candidatus Dormibacteraeota bacterium]